MGQAEEKAPAWALAAAMGGLLTEHRVSDRLRGSRCVPACLHEKLYEADCHIRLGNSSAKL